MHWSIKDEGGLPMRNDVNCLDIFVVLSEYNFKGIIVYSDLSK